MPVGVEKVVVPMPKMLTRSQRLDHSAQRAHRRHFQRSGVEKVMVPMPKMLTRSQRLDHSAQLAQRRHFQRFQGHRFS
jgi:hypothetical protein